jgi:hypothetical protein
MAALMVEIFSMILADLFDFEKILKKARGRPV